MSHDIIVYPTAVEIRQCYVPGSGLSWADEFVDLISRDAPELITLMRSVEREGWDGHHRVMVGLLLGMAVPAVLVFDPEDVTQYGSIHISSHCATATDVVQRDVRGT